MSRNANLGSLGQVSVDVVVELQKLNKDLAQVKVAVTDSLGKISEIDKKVSFKNAEGSLVSFGKQAAALFGVGGGMYLAANTLKQLGAEAIAFQKSMSNVATLLVGTGVNVNGLSNQLLALDGSLGSSAELADSMYEALSAGVEPAKAIDFVTTSTKLASAELFNAGQATKLLATVMNAYGKEVTNVAHVSDVFVDTINVGIVRGDELAGALGNVIPTAAQAGVSIEELGAAIAVMTRTGLSADEATTGLNRAILSFIAPSAEAKKTAAELGVELSAQRLKTLGLKDAITELVNATKGNLEAQANLFGDVRGFRTALALTGKQAEEYAGILEHMKTAAGQTDAAFKIQQDNISTQLTNAWNNISKTVTGFISQFEGPLTDALKEVNSLFSQQTDLAKKLSEGWGILGINMDKLTTSIGTSQVGMAFFQSLQGQLGITSAGADQAISKLNTLQQVSSTLKAMGGPDIKQGTMDLAEWEKALNAAMMATQGYAAATTQAKVVQKEQADTITEATLKMLDQAKSAIPQLTEEQKKLTKSFEDSLMPLTKLEAELKTLSMKFSETQIIAVYRDQIIKATEEQKKHGGEVSKTVQHLYELAIKERDATKAQEERTKQTEQERIEQERLNASFLQALKPADDLSKTLQKLAATFSQEDIIKVYGQQILDATAKQREHGYEIDENIKKLEEMALAAQTVVEAASQPIEPIVPMVAPGAAEEAGRDAGDEWNDGFQSALDDFDFGGLATPRRGHRGGGGFGGLGALAPTNEELIRIFKNTALDPFGLYSQAEFAAGVGGTGMTTRFTPSSGGKATFGMTPQTVATSAIDIPPAVETAATAAATEAVAASDQLRISSGIPQTGRAVSAAEIFADAVTKFDAAVSLMGGGGGGGAGGVQIINQFDNKFMMDTGDPLYVRDVLMAQITDALETGARGYREKWAQIIDDTIDGLTSSQVPT